MKNNFDLKFNIKDVFVIIFAILLIIASIISTNTFLSSTNIENSNVEIYYHQEKIQSIKFSSIVDEQTIILKKDNFPELLGDFKILISKEKGICVKDIDCPNHYCEQEGWVKRLNYPVTCLPNSVYVVLSNPNVDDVILVG